MKLKPKQKLTKKKLQKRTNPKEKKQTKHEHTIKKKKTLKV